MSFQKGQKVYLKDFPFVHGTISNVIDEGPGEDASIVVQPDAIRRRASDFESAEIPKAPESPIERFVRVMNGPLRQVPAQWCADPNNPALRDKLTEFLSEMGWLKPLPKK
jgi:hypothetical protein